MIAFFKRILGGGEKRQDPARYEREKDIARADDAAKRLALAGNAKTHQEILYYMAQNDPDPDVRLAVARNRSTPVQASLVLAADNSEDVRLALAQRLVSLLPDLSAERHSQLYAFAAQALGTLALDEVLKIRKALSSTLKDYAFAPPKVAGQLARDVEREVSEPILRFCSALSDEDLLEILKDHPAGWVVQAIAGRASVSDSVSEAVIEADDRPAGVILLENKGAEISRSLLETIVERARHYPEWQKPAAVHKNLSPQTASVLAEFADGSVRAILMRRKDFDEQTIAGIASVFKRRLSYVQEAYADSEPRCPLHGRLAKKDALNEAALSDALAMRDMDFVHAAIARLARTDISSVERIFRLKAAKPIVALSWQAGLSMRFALQLQQEAGQVPPRELVYPRGGTDYPLTSEEMLWQLEFLGILAA